MKLNRSLKKALQEAGASKGQLDPMNALRKRWELNRTIFDEWCKKEGLPKPEYEYLFAPPRKWRFDIAFSGSRFGVAVEIQGGLFSGGRHVRGPALLKEYEKINEAQILGYKVLFVTPKQIDSGEAMSLVKRALGV